MALSSTLFPHLSLFNATFHQPSPPLIATELSGIFIQHKYSNTLSHIVCGFWYNSAIHQKVRIDETYDGGYGTSFFDYTNTSSSGGVSNVQVIVGPSMNSTPSCFEDYVGSPGFPLITATYLQDVNASFGGAVLDPWVGEVQSWDFLYGGGGDGGIAVVVYLDDQEPAVLQGYDFWGTAERTKVVTRFFAQKVGEIGAEVFAGIGCPEQKQSAEAPRSDM
ncbi:uncharacterized protein AB675_26 [Cyphellophora attinorum]|uniref:Uncharacterized protein n=1 Tax=Cyphellophora attinorum TaxID=1664694 RepID=A0A0N1H348_9EURO|nr:uncharacterized protein AB675_26 [Phialophora attinorum]KPI34733.1 hypothetical protein AB675_26 [Phialophora attinorum]